MKELRVRDIMTPEVTTLKRNDKLTLADDIMHLGRIRHLPVLDDDGHQLVGIVSQRDLFRGALATALGYGQSAQRKLLDSLLVKEVMSTDVITTGPNTLLAEAARVLVQRLHSDPQFWRSEIAGHLIDVGSQAFAHYG